MWALLLVAFAVAFARADGAASEFRFDRDTFAFANQTVFEYHEGHASLRKSSPTKKEAYNSHCFVMSRTALKSKSLHVSSREVLLDDASLATRIRAVTRQAAWAEPLPANQRIVFSGYKDLKEMSKAHRELVQLSHRTWLAELLPSQQCSDDVSRRSGFQEQTHAQLNAALARGELFVAFLTTYPQFSINHSVLIYS